jgi:hypothetical protein
MRPDPALADGVDVIDGGAKADRLHDRGRPSLKPVRRFTVTDVVPVHLANHLAAAVEGRHRREMLMLAVERADTGRPVQFVTGDDIEIAIDVADIDIQVHGRLRAIDEHRDSPRMRDPHHLLDRHDGAQNVRHLRDGDHLGTVGQQPLEFVDQEIAVFIHRRPFDDRALAFPQEMPGNDICVVLHDGEHDFIARPDPLAPEGLGDEVDPRSRPR